MNGEESSRCVQMEVLDFGLVRIVDLEASVACSGPACGRRQQNAVMESACAPETMVHTGVHCES